MKIAKLSDIGKTRTMNQDACASGEFPDGTVWAVVCDGMGGAASGDVASTTAVRIISEKITSSYREGMGSNSVRSLLFSAIEAANSVVYDMSKSNFEFFGMGTTVVAAVISNKTVCIAHVGDSRAYRISEDSMTQLTRDHSMVQAMVDQGQITSLEAKTHPQKNVITRAVGAEPTVLIDFCEEEFDDGNVLLICTDGLTNTVEDSEIFEMSKNYDCAELSQKLIETANNNGGYDNITVVLIAY